MPSAKIRNYSRSHNLMSRLLAHQVVFSCILQLISPCHLHSFEESLHGRFPETVFPRVRPLGVIRVHPSVKVCLQLFCRGVYLLSESDGVGFVLDSPVEAFTDAFV